MDIGTNAFTTYASADTGGLAALGHRITSSPDSYFDFGAGQFVVGIDGGYLAASDPRRDGQAAGF